VSEIFPQDNPIDRASIAKLDPDQLIAYIGVLQERRLKSYKIYEAGLKAKQEAKDAKTAKGMERSLERLSKLFTKIDKDLDTAEKLAIEVQAYRLALGDLT